MRTPREAAFRTLLEVDRGRRLDRAFGIHGAAVPERSRGWVHELTHGVVRLRGRLDHLLDLHLARGIESLSVEVRILLEMGAYQLLMMGSVPGYAAVSETVDGVREVGGPGLAGMANGVLRSLARKGGGEERFPSLETDPVGHLSTWGSHPRWLVERWVARWGVGETARLVAWNNRIPTIHLRILGGMTAEEALRRLGEVGIEAEVGPPASGTVRLARGSGVEEALGAVPAVVQDPAAAWVVRWAGNVAGLEGADLCAAPGGKCFGLIDGGARMIALDPSGPRIALVRESAHRLALHLPVVRARGEAPPLRPRDLVVVDAPCTGTGTLGRHPDARWRLEPGAPAQMAQVQDTILDGAAGVVREGGLLLYATCSLEPEENEDRMEAFLGRHPHFILEGTDDSGVEIPDAATDASVLRVLPQRTGTDGAFAARLRRRG